jgi:hypothetical protein
MVEWLNVGRHRGAADGFQKPSPAQDSTPKCSFEIELRAVDLSTTPANRARLNEAGKQAGNTRRVDLQPATSPGNELPAERWLDGEARTNSGSPYGKGKREGHTTGKTPIDKGYFKADKNGD